jgi:small GTP-binding protein
MSSKIIEIGIIGDTQTGKTSLTNYYTGLGFTDRMTATVGIDLYVKTIKYRKKEYKLKIYDTAGQEIYHNLALNIFRKCQGLILVYSIDNTNSFDNVKNKWIKDIDDMFDVLKIPIILVGNKKDLEKERIISEKEGLEIAKQKNYLFYETSAKTGENVNQIFQCLFEQIINVENIKKEDNNNNNKDDGKENNKSKKGKKCIIF